MIKIILPSRPVLSDSYDLGKTVTGMGDRTILVDKDPCLISSMPLLKYPSIGRLRTC